MKKKLAKSKSHLSGKAAHHRAAFYYGLSPSDLEHSHKDGGSEENLYDYVKASHDAMAQSTGI